MILFTIGYEGLDVEAFFFTLREARVETLLDVRQLPLSRKRGFSKNALRAESNSRGIAYLHRVEFGCPKQIRLQYKHDGDWFCYVERFNAYLETQELSLRQLASEIGETRCCLLCFEADAHKCHRSLVADRVRKLSTEPLIVRHLKTPSKSECLP